TECEGGQGHFQRGKRQTTDAHYCGKDQGDELIMKLRTAGKPTEIDGADQFADGAIGFTCHDGAVVASVGFDCATQDRARQVNLTGRHVEFYRHEWFTRRRAVPDIPRFERSLFARLGEVQCPPAKKFPMGSFVWSKTPVQAAIRRYVEMAGPD